MKKLGLIKTVFDGFFMAAADSVPGVSGGTIAFLLGFYEKLIKSINDLIYGKKQEKKQGLLYLLNLAVGWVTGLAICAVFIASFFQKHIYEFSSFFIGLTLAAIPVIIYEEKTTLKGHIKKIFYILLGMLLVAAITYLRVSLSGDFFGGLSSNKVLYLIFAFFGGILGISAMILPGLSGSTVLLILGLYIPIISAIKSFLHLDFSVVPLLVIFSLGVITGICLTVRILKKLLENHRAGVIYFVIGMMISSVYAIAMGPLSLTPGQAPLCIDNLSIGFLLIGAVIIIALEISKVSIKNHSSK